MTGAPRLLDLYCGSGGCSDGYAAAGFTVTGVDLDDGLDAMGYTPGRMPWRRLTQAIPPAYTLTLGTQVRAHLDAARAVS